ncbi:MAG: hypothetical protein BJ554DRAFT_2612 [Olpidium bornovanus]|uniref:GOLD domain-containing protein n=1 Tax=Olpidium bornovanus TaxID=278681 RepID=A0A8H7ZQH8_9FUNG|nr:MAG: hypothetical protein BJ554DRAFT_2612 [Olpidium bornovanus]
MAPAPTTRKPAGSAKAASLAVALVLLLALALLPSAADALHFYLIGSEQKCFTEDLPKGTTVHGTAKKKKKKEKVTFRDLHPPSPRLRTRKSAETTPREVALWRGVAWRGGGAQATRDPTGCCLVVGFGPVDMSKGGLRGGEKDRKTNPRNCAGKLPRSLPGKECQLTRTCLTPIRRSGDYRLEDGTEGHASVSSNPALSIQLVVEVSPSPIFHAAGCQTSGSAELPQRHRILNQRGQHEGKFAFTSAESGEHAICISTNATARFSSLSTVSTLGLRLYYIWEAHGLGPAL